MGFDTLELSPSYNQGGEAPWPLPPVESGAADGRPQDPGLVKVLLSRPRPSGARRGLLPVVARSERARVALLVLATGSSSG